MILCLLGGMGLEIHLCREFFMVQLYFSGLLYPFFYIDNKMIILISKESSQGLDVLMY